MSHPAAKMLCGLGAALALTTAHCGDADDGVGTSFFSAAVDELVVEVDYQVGAEPTPRVGVPLFKLVQVNLDHLFAGTTQRISLPGQLADMESITGLDNGPFSNDDILHLAEAHRDAVATKNRTSVYVLFLNGFYEVDGEALESVLGVAFPGTGVIALFKPAMASNDADVRFVEQSTLVHEIGHAVGLVNNGVPLTSAHHDADHGAHCTNSNCVMYHLNEGARDLIAFIRRVQVTGESVLFGPECIADAGGSALTYRAAIETVFPDAEDHTVSVIRGQGMLVSSLAELAADIVLGSRIGR